MFVNVNKDFAQRSRFGWHFSSFAIISGLGWLCDFSTFTLLVNLFDVSDVAANFVSSYLGVTFVWLISPRMVFGRSDAGGGKFLFAYWVFQFLSILAYSELLNLVVYAFQVASLPGWLLSNASVSAKIIITPFNLVTNFLFMAWLTRYMHQSSTIQS